MKLIDAQTMAAELMAEHGLTEKGWRFNWDKAVRRFGACHYGLKQITLSRALTELNDEAVIRNTILHEIAHAIAGNAAGHGYLWKAHAIRIGCNGERCYSSDVVEPEPKYTGECSNCGRVIKKHRRARLACGQCCKKFNNNRWSEEYIIKWQ